MSDLTIFSRYNKHLKNQLAKEFYTFDHHTLHVYQGIFSMHLCAGKHTASVKNSRIPYQKPESQKTHKNPRKLVLKKPEKTQKNP